MNKYKYLSSSLAVALMAFLLSCNQGKNVSQELEETEVLPEDIVEMRADQKELAGIQLGVIEFRFLKSQLKVNGSVIVSPQNEATVCTPVGGFIQSVSLIPGNAVLKGQVLAVIESQDFLDLQQSYLDARNRLEFSKAEYTRHSELYKQDVYSEKNLQQVTADYKSLQALTRALGEKLKLAGMNPEFLQEDNISMALSIRAPISGYIRTVNVNLGKYMSPTDVLFEIVNSDYLMLELTMFDKDADKVREGQALRFFINNETEPHGAEIIQTAKAIGPDKTYKAYARVTEDCENVLPGMYVNALIETSGNEPVASLPSEAVVTFDDQDYIFIFEQEKEENGQPFTEYRMIPVSKGIADEGFVEVVLPEGFDMATVKVVVKGAYNLLSAKKNAGEMAC